MNDDIGGKKALIEWLGFAVTALAFSFTAWKYAATETRDFRADVRARLYTLDSQLVRLEEHEIAHGISSAGHIENIKWNRDRVIDLMTNSRARNDPFTGEDGAALIQRIEQLEGKGK